MAAVPTAAEVRHEQRAGELCLGALRALSGRPGLLVRGDRLYDGSRRLPLFAPHLRPVPGRDDFASFRGAADGIALRLRWSDEQLHMRLRPDAPGARLVFDLLEQYRVEAMGQDLEGVRSNLRHRHEAWLDEVNTSGLADTARGLLLYTLAWTARSRVTGDPIPDDVSDHIEGTRFALAPAIGSALAGLRKCRHDQAAYAVHAQAIAAHLGDLLDSEGEKTAAAQGRPDVERRFDSLLLDMDTADDAEGRATGLGVRHAAGTADTPYRIFTTAHDRVWTAPQLVRAAALREHRQRLDERVAAQGANVPRLARDLQAVLGHVVEEGWEGGQEEGWIDGARLAQLVAVPGERRVFRRSRTEIRLDVDVTVLVDCSGSMRAHAESIAMMADLLARALDLAGARSEVLGFTTSGWNGGEARRDWQRAGRPPEPGRLNGLSHIIFKEAEVPWRRARTAMAALLEQHLFREGIDGEAVQWACERLHAGGAARRVLLVVSDGCPMDAATAQANGPWYLDEHLREVVRREEQRGTEILGVGVGLDLSPYYRRSLVLDLSGRLTNAVFAELVQLMRPRPR